jgi:hypothetical protein
MGATAVVPPIPFRLGDEFAGWHTNPAADADGGGFFDFATQISADLTLYAIWRAPVPPLNITFWVVNDSGGTLRGFDGFGAEQTSVAQVDSGSGFSFTATAAAIPAPGYRIREWTHNNAIVNGTNTNFEIEDIIQHHWVSVEFERIPYTVALLASAGGTAEGDADGVPLILGAMREVATDTPINFYATPNEGFLFSHWYFFADDTARFPLPSETQNPGRVYMPETHIGIVAIFIAEPYPRVAVNHTAGGVAFGVVERGLDEIAIHGSPIHVVPNETVRLFAAPDRWHRFSHWEIDLGGGGMTPPLNTFSAEPTFIMPINNVSVRAHFVPRESMFHLLLLEVSGSEAESGRLYRMRNAATQLVTE